MNLRLTGIAVLAALLSVRCGDARDQPAAAAKPAMTVEEVEPVTLAAASTPVTVPYPSGERRVTRTIDQDPDGDGIANRRVMITETYDATGELVERLREVDVEADGIIDARSLTRFGD